MLTCGSEVNLKLISFRIWNTGSKEFSQCVFLLPHKQTQSNQHIIIIIIINFPVTFAYTAKINALAPLETGL